MSRRKCGSGHRGLEFDAKRYIRGMKAVNSGD